jgi:hypothetical protein
MKVVKVIDKYNYVIDAGSNKEISLNDKFVVYLKGEEIIDQESGKSLGTLELPKTRCYATHVQENITIIRSEDAPKKSFFPDYSSLALVLGSITEDSSPYNFLPEDERKVKIGDSVKEVSE